MNEPKQKTFGIMWPGKLEVFTVTILCSGPYKKERGERKNKESPRKDSVVLMTLYIVDAL